MSLSIGVGFKITGTFVIKILQPQVVRKNGISGWRILNCEKWLLLGPSNFGLNRFDHYLNKDLLPDWYQSYFWVHWQGCHCFHRNFRHRKRRNPWGFQFRPAYFHKLLSSFPSEIFIWTKALSSHKWTVTTRIGRSLKTSTLDLNWTYREKGRSRKKRAAFIIAGKCWAHKPKSIWLFC